MQFSAGMGGTIKDKIASHLLNFFANGGIDQQASSSPLNLIQQAFAKEGISLDETTALHILKGITSSITGETSAELPEGITKKNDGVDISHLHPKVSETFAAIIETWQTHNAPAPVITSGNDAVHSSPNSKHYSDRAIDLRGNNVSDEVLRKMADDLREKLGSDYFVQAEFFPNNPSNDHIHIQYNGS